MVLDSVWNNLDDTVKRAIVSVAAAHDRVDTRKLLAALLAVSDVDSVRDLIQDMRDVAGVDLPSVEPVDDEVGDAPVDLMLSPAVKEALSFFNMHRIRNVSPANLIVRLLQLSGDEFTLSLDKQERLSDYINEFRNLQSG